MAVNVLAKIYLSLSGRVITGVEGHLIRYISVIYRGNLLQYKSIYGSCMYIVLKKVPEYRYPLYFEKFKIEPISPC